MMEKTLKKKRIYKGRIVGLREDTVKLVNGVISKREIVEHPGAVAVIAVTKDGKMVLIRQFRKPAEKVLLEIPAGLVHKGESNINGARRELTEETGYVAGKIREIFGGYSSPGYSTEIIRFYLATDLKKTRQSCDADEIIRVELCPIKKCLKMLMSGKIRDNKTAVGILMANLTPDPLSLLRRGEQGENYGR
jgi:ADP-ribose pyrophosphatase